MFEDAKASRGARRRRSAGTRRTLRLTMFSCLSERSTLTSLSVVFRTTASSSDSLNFFTATTSPVFLSRHLSTTPYAPSPTTPTTSYLFIARERARARRATPGRTAVAEDPPPPRAHLSRRRGPPPAPSPTPLRHANVSPARLGANGTSRTFPSSEEENVRLCGEADGRKESPFRTKSHDWIHASENTRDILFIEPGNDELHRCGVRDADCAPYEKALPPVSRDTLVRDKEGFRPRVSGFARIR